MNKNQLAFWGDILSAPPDDNCVDYVTHILGEHFTINLSDSLKSSPQKWRQFIQSAGEKFGFYSVPFPQDGDVVLMSHHDIPHHIGIFIEGKILHKSAHLSPMADSVAGITHRGYKIIGFYRYMPHICDSATTPMPENLTLHGGGGGNPFRILATIAVIAVAAWAAPAIAGAIGATSVAATTAITAGLTMAGNFALNALLPPAIPSLGDFSAASGYSNPSPTYSVQNRQNQARIGGAIPVLYGRHLITPDLAASAWFEYDNNEQYLHQLLVVSQGHCEIEDIKIGDTSLINYEGVEIQGIAPGEDVTLFDCNIYQSREVSGQELLSESKITGAGAIVEGDIFDADFVKSATEIEDNWRGPFIAVPSGKKTTQIAIDIACPQGLYYANDSGGLSNATVAFTADYRPISDDGSPLGDYQELLSDSITAADNGAIFKTYKNTVALGRYEVRMRRTNSDSTSSRTADTVQWQGLRSYLTDGVVNFGNLTLLALRIKASDQLNQQTYSRISVLGSRKLPTYENGAWTAPQKTSSLAWAIADMLRNKIYGAGLDDARIDLTQLSALNAIWQARGDMFNAVIDSHNSLWQILNRTLQVGRSTAYQQAGMVRFYRDEKVSCPVQLFNNLNIIENSFSCVWNLPTRDEKPDGITLEYFDALTWRPATISRHANGNDENPARPVRIHAFGITNANHAMREADYNIQLLNIRREIISFEAEMEAVALSYGDAILIAREVMDWGHADYASAWDGENLHLTLSEPCPLSGDLRIVFRNTIGGVENFVQNGDDLITAKITDDAHILKLSAAPAIDIHCVNTSPAPTHVVLYGLNRRPAQLAIVQNIEILNNADLYKARVTAVAYDERIHVN